MIMFVEVCGYEPTIRIQKFGLRWARHAKQSSLNLFISNDIALMMKMMMKVM